MSSYEKVFDKQNMLAVSLLSFPPALSKQSVSFVATAW